MQTILGAGGAIGFELAKALKEYTDEIRLVSRRPQKVNDTDHLFPADLLNRKELENAVKGSEVVYLTVGFPYNYKDWQKKWPKLIKNLIEICEKENCKLVFFDNVYMYDKGHLDSMTENTPVNPSNKKGKVRATIAHLIMKKAKEGKLKALIARSADFYGPSIKETSLLTETVFNPLKKGKTANWLMSDEHKHSFTFTPDAGKATALLGNTENAYGQIWHLPTATQPMTGKEWIEKIASKLNVKPKYRTVSKLMVHFIGLFVPAMRESVEMLYQYNRDYVFDSSKFEKEFAVIPTTYEKGIELIVEADY